MLPTPSGTAEATPRFFDMVRLVFKCLEHDVPVIVSADRANFHFVSDLLPLMTCSCCGNVHGWEINDRLLDSNLTDVLLLSSTNMA